MGKPGPIGGAFWGGSGGLYAKTETPAKSITTQHEYVNIFLRIFLSMIYNKIPIFYF